MGGPDVRHTPGYPIGRVTPGYPIGQSPARKDFHVPTLDANSKSIIALYDWVKATSADETGALCPVPIEWPFHARAAVYACRAVLREIGLIKTHKRYFAEAPDQVGWMGDVIVAREQASPHPGTPSAD